MKFGTILITGASSGLGEEFARQLSADGVTLILVARREERLEALARNLEEDQEVRVLTIRADLSDESERLGVFERCKKEGLVPDLLINNAGLGDYGEFSEAEWSKTAQILEVNIEALTHLTHLFLRGLTEQRGAIINVSSLAGDLPIPDFAVYAASKAYVSSFSDALGIELAEKGVSVLAVCPGPVSTEFGESARRSGGNLPIKESFKVPKEEVVGGALSALSRRRPRFYPGGKIKIAALLIGLAPLAAVRLMMKSRPRRSR